MPAADAAPYGRGYPADPPGQKAGKLKLTTTSDPRAVLGCLPSRGHPRPSGGRVVVLPAHSHAGVCKGGRDRGVRSGAPEANRPSASGGPCATAHLQPRASGAPKIRSARSRISSAGICAEMLPRSQPPPASRIVTRRDLQTDAARHTESQNIMQRVIGPAVREPCFMLRFRGVAPTKPASLRSSPAVLHGTPNPAAIYF
jgi:hypothetical protein